MNCAWAVAALCAVAVVLARPARADVRNGVEVGTSWLAGDQFVDLTPWLQFEDGPLQFGLAAPVRFRVLDSDPKDSCATPGLRCQDWDTRTDWTRILRHLDWGGWSGDINVHIGDLTGITVGHGELVHRYYNNLLFDTWRTGALIEVMQPTWGLTALTGDVLQADMLALRAWGRPVTHGYWQRLRFGLQAAFDRKVGVATAPGVLGPDATPVGSGGPWQADAPLIAADLSLLVWGDDRRALSSWFSLSGHVADAMAVHLGTSFHRRGALAAVISLEGRYILPIGSHTASYMPAWFGPTYELDSHSLHNAVASAPDRTGLATGGTKATFELARENGFRLVSLVDWLYDRRLDTEVWWQTNPHAQLSVRAMWFKRWHRQSASDPLDQMAYATAKLRVSDIWYANLALGKRWRLSETFAAGQSPLHSELEVRLGFGGQWQW